MKEALSGAFSVLVLDMARTGEEDGERLVAGDWTALASI
jgi:hypothetical protein